jgi:anti-anti-sigma factor
MKERRPTYFEIYLSGRLDTNTYLQLDKTLEMVFENKVRGLQLNFENLEYISSMGLRMILKAMKMAKSNGAAFMVANMQPQIEAVFKVANALPSQSIFSSVAEADQYFDNIQTKAKDHRG